MFKLEKDPITGYIYCLRHHQTIQSRKYEKMKLPQDPYRPNPVFSPDLSHNAFESPRHTNSMASNQIQQMRDRSLPFGSDRIEEPSRTINPQDRPIDERISSVIYANEREAMLESSRNRKKIGSQQISRDDLASTREDPKVG